MGTHFKQVGYSEQIYRDQGFFTISTFQVASAVISIEEVVAWDLFKPEYHESEDDKKAHQEWYNRMSWIGQLEYDLQNENEEEHFGPVVKDEIQGSCFVKHNFESFSRFVEEYADQWTGEGKSNLASGLLESVKQVTHLLDDAASKTYYVMDAASLADEQGFYEIDWSFHFTVVITGQSTGKLFIVQLAQHEYNVTGD